jgi:hypothetical protein
VFDFAPSQTKIFTPRIQNFLFLKKTPSVEILCWRKGEKLLISCVNLTFSGEDSVSLQGVPAQAGLSREV